MSNTDISFQSDTSNIGNVRQALAALHAKVAMLEKDRDSHAHAASSARSEHEDYKIRMEAELNRERLIAAERERQLLEDVAAAEAEIHHLKERLRSSSLNPLPQRGHQTDADMEFEQRAAQQMESEKQRIDDAEHEINKLEAERQVLESANVQLDQTIQHLLRSNEDLLQMLRITPRSNSPNVNPASARGAVENNKNNINNRIVMATSGRSRPSSSNNNNNRNIGGLPPTTASNNSRTSSPLQQPPLRYQNNNTSVKRSNNNSAAIVGMNNSLSQRETVSSMQRNRKNGSGASSFHRDPYGAISTSNNASTFERLAQPQRSCSRNRAVSPPHCTHTRIAHGTAKNTARRFLTQELRSHANESVPH